MYPLRSTDRQIKKQHPLRDAENTDRIWLSAMLTHRCNNRNWGKNATQRNDEWIKERLLHLVYSLVAHGTWLMHVASS